MPWIKIHKIPNNNIKTPEASPLTPRHSTLFSCNKQQLTPSTQAELEHAKHGQALAEERADEAREQLEEALAQRKMVDDLIEVGDKEVSHSDSG